MLRGLVYALMSATCYGLGPIIFKLGLASGLTEMQLLLSRFLLAAPLLGGYLFLADKSKLKPGPRTLIRAAVAAVVFYGLESFCFMKALSHIPAVTNSLIFYLYPLAVTLLSAAFLRFRISRITRAALTVILFGSALVCHDAFLRQAPLLGVLFSLAAMALFSCYLIVVQRFMREEDPLTFTLYVFVFMALGYCLFESPAVLAGFRADQFLWCALAAIFPSALAVPLLYASIRRIGSAYASIFSSFELVATLAAAWLILGERISAEQIGGMVCIMTGVALPNLRLQRLGAKLRRKRTSA